MLPFDSNRKFCQKFCRPLVETLWQGIYYHDRDHPDYGDNLVTALEANLDTLKHVLYAQQNYAQFNPEPFDPAWLQRELQQFLDEKDDGDVQDYVNSLAKN